MTDILRLKEQFDAIGNVSGRLEKESLIETFKEDYLFRDVLNFVFNPFIITGLAKKKIEKELPDSPIKADYHIADLMIYVRNHNSGSDAIISIVQSWIRQQPQQTHQFLKDLFTKDIQIGISHKTINKVIGKNFIPEYGVQLAKNYFDEEEKVKGPFAVTLKLDGIRCTCFNEESGPKFFSRKGLPIEGMTELEELFKKLPTNQVYDGELLAANPNNLPSKDLFRITQKVVKTDGPKSGIRLVIFDTLPIDEFFEGQSKKNYEERVEPLEAIIGDMANELVELVPMYYIGSDKDKIGEILKHVTSEGYEGLMINLLEGKYEVKRSSNLLKVKEMHTVDLQITGFEEHRKQPNKLGALVVDYKGNRVNVGSGFTDVDRDYIWKNQDKLLGTIVEVQYFEESSNQNGGISLRFPVFIQLRDDKDEVSYN